jgi:PAS domain S-box-containing protein
MFELAGVGTAQADPATGRLLRVNPKLCEIIGYSEEELLNLTFMEITHPGDRQEDFEGFQRAIRGEASEYEAEKRYVRKNGQVVWVSVNTRIIRDQAGQPVCTVAAIHDITGRMQAEEALRRSEKRFRLLVQNSSDIISVFDAEGTVTYQSPSIERVLGHKPEERIGKNIFESPLVHPDDLASEVDFFTNACHNPGIEVRGSFRLQHADGSWRHIEAIGKNLLHDLSVRGIIGNYRDVTARKRTEEIRRQLAAIVESSEDAIIAKTLDGIITAWNEGAQRLYGYSAEEVVGQYISILAPPEHSDEIPAILRRIGRGERIAQHETVRVAKDGRRLDISLSVSPIRDDEGNVVGASTIARDITERKRAEKEIETRARQQATVAQLGARALARDEPQAIMDEAVALVARTLEVEYCKLLKLLPGGEELLLVAGVGWNKGLVGNATVGAGLGSQAGYTLLSDEAVIVEDLRTESRFSESPLLREHGVVSGVSVVVQGRDEPFGVLDVHTTEPRTFSKDDVNFLQAVANVLAAAVGRRSAEEALIRVREAERSRIARDIHDEALQHILYALREIGTHRELSEDGERATGLEEAANALQRSVTGLRAAIFDLPLAGGDEDGDFVKQLGSLVRLNRQSSPDREIELSVEEDLPQSLGKSTEVELQRIVQEALANVRRHSGAGRVSVAVGASRGKLWAEVEDDGRGFGPETPAGMGTRGMRERARALGGSLKIESEPGKGTKVRFEMALPSDGKETKSEEAIRILLIEDHASFREAAAAVFEKEPGFEVVGQVNSFATARKMFEDGASEADVAIVDLGLPDGYGADLIKELRAVNPRAQALVLSGALDRAEIARAVESGAAGVLHKSADMSEVIRAVRRVRAGETLLPPQEVIELLRVARLRREQEQEARQAITQLTPREKDVLQALAEGLDSKEIAQRLTISATTERNHVASILAKLGVHSRLQALIFAVRHGVVEIC